MGSCSTSIQSEAAYMNVPGNEQSNNSLEHKPIHNELIIYGHIHQFQAKHPLFAIIPDEVCQNIVSYTDPNEPILISIPTLSVIKSGNNSCRISIQHQSNDITKYRLTFINIDRHHNLTRAHKSKDKNYGMFTIKDLEEEKEYQLTASGQNKYELTGQESNILSFKTYAKWKFDVVTKRNEDCISNDGQIFTIRRDPGYSGTALYVSASCRQGYRNGVHEFKMKLVGDGGFQCSFGITSGGPYTSRKEIKSGNKGTKYYFYDRRDTTGIYTNKHTFLCRLASWRKLDNIVMHLDCENWTLQYEIVSVNNYRFDQLSPKRSEKIKIKANETYYPFVQSRRVGWSFRIVHT